MTETPQVIDPWSQLVVTDVTVDGPVLPMLAPTSFRVRSGEVRVVAGEPGHGHTALSLILGGRLAPDAGHVELDGSDDPARRRQRVALVDVPGVSEPDGVLTLATVAGEELAIARQKASRPAVRRWLEEHDCLAYADVQVEHLPPYVRVASLCELASLRPRVKFVVLTAPDRHGGDPQDWWAYCWALATDQNVGVIVTCTPTTADLLDVRTARLDETDHDGPTATLPEDLHQREAR